MRADLDWHRSRKAQKRSRHNALVGVLGMIACGLVAGWAAPDLIGLAASPTASSRGGVSVYAAPRRRQTISFGFCHTGGGTNCVVDGDTFWMDGEKIRVADIDAPETHPPRCAEEAALGDRATKRFHDLLNAGPVILEPIDRDRDRYGRKLRVVRRDGSSLGETLVAEGLARRWIGHREPWCGLA